MKQAGINFKLEKGIKYEQMLRKQVNSNLYVLLKGITKAKLEFSQKTLTFMFLCWNRVITITSPWVTPTKTFC